MKKLLALLRSLLIKIGFLAKPVPRQLDFLNQLNPATKPVTTAQKK
jgi:hypothetical protein